MIILSTVLIVFAIFAIRLYRGGLSIDFGSLFRVYSAEGSWYARISSYTYFLRMMFYKPFIGIGMITELSTPDAYSILHGPYGINYASDVGIVGTLAICGVLATIVYLYIIINLFIIILLISFTNSIASLSNFLNFVVDTKILSLPRNSHQ